MPDRYGRFSLADGFGMAQQVLGFSDYQDKAQVEQGLGMLSNGVTERPENINNQNWLKAEKRHTEGLALKDQREDLKFKSNVKDRMDTYVPLLEQSNYNFDSLAVKDSTDVSAVGQLVKMYGETEQGKSVIRKNRGEMLARQYSVFNAGRKQTDEFLKAGKKDQAAMGIMELTNQVPMPYKLDEYDPETDSFSVKYIESKAGPKEVNRVSLNDVMHTMNNVSEKRFFEQGALHAEAVRQSNLEYRTNPTKHYRAKNKDGQAVTIVPQKNIHDLSDVDYIVYSAGSDPYTVRSMGELQKQGFMFENLDTEKKRADIAHTVAQTGKVYADTGKSFATTHKTQAETAQIQAQAERMPGKQANEKLVQMRKSFGDALKPFHQKGKTLLDPDTYELTNEGNNAFNDAAKLVDDYRSGKWKPANEADKTKLQAARQAVGIYQQILQSGSVHVPAEDPAQREQVNEIKQLIKQFGKDGARKVLSKRTEMGTKNLPSGISESGYGG